MSPLAPGILIAAPPLTDPNFDRSVVLLVSHDEEGAFGWVLNGPELMSVDELLVRAAIREEEEPSSGAIEVPGVVRRGGPVSEEQVWLVYPAASRLVGIEGQFEVSPGIFATTARAFLERLAEGEQVPGVRAFAGYAGWAPGQLEREIQQGGWLPGPLGPELVFDAPVDDLWQRAFALLGASPLAFTSRTVGMA